MRALFPARPLLFAQTLLSFSVLSLARTRPTAFLRLAADADALQSPVLRFPLHFLMQTRTLTANVVCGVIAHTGPVVLLQLDKHGRKPFYYLTRPFHINGNTNQASHDCDSNRSDSAVAELVLEVAKLNPSLAQVLLQQSSEHGYTEACRRLVEYGAHLDVETEVDARVPREIGIVSEKLSHRKWQNLTKALLEKPHREEQDHP